MHTGERKHKHMHSDLSCGFAFLKFCPKITCICIRWILEIVGCTPSKYGLFCDSVLGAGAK